YSGDILLVASALFSVLSIEAYLNHLAAELLPDLEKDKRLSWQKKLAAICDILEIDQALAKETENEVRILFDFRNRLSAEPKPTTRRTLFAKRVGWTRNGFGNTGRKPKSLKSGRLRRKSSTFSATNPALGRGGFRLGGFSRKST